MNLQQQGRVGYKRLSENTLKTKAYFRVKSYVKDTITNCNLNKAQKCVCMYVCANSHTHIYRHTKLTYYTVS